MAANKQVDRRGMTLVELLVVMVIILILATIVVAFAPGFQDAQKVSRGADQLQGWLLMARQWAKKDRVPTGLRLFVTNNQVTDLQYVQQPPTYTVPFNIGSVPPNFRRLTTLATPSTLQLEPATAAGSVLAPGGLGAPPNIGDFSGGSGLLSDRSAWPVQAGDFLVIKGSIYQVIDFSSSTSPPGPPGECDRVTVATNVNPVLVNGSGTNVFTSDYYFVRGPRPLTGESTLKLPQDVAIIIDSGQPNYRSNVSPNASGVIDILFSPSGEVLSPVSSNKVILLIRDVTKPILSQTGSLNILDDTLIAVSSRTGLIAAQPVNPDPALGDYYYYTRDGRPSGL